MTVTQRNGGLHRRHWAVISALTCLTLTLLLLAACGIPPAVEATFSGGPIWRPE